MKHIRHLLILLAFHFGWHGASAQESPVAAGGEGLGSGGTVSFSVGQVAYITMEDSTGSVAQGVQQPIEISITVGVEETSVHLELSAYPNPTIDYLTLRVDDNSSGKRQLRFLLLDMHGRTLRTGTAVGSTSINMLELPVATYFLKIVENQRPIKTFQIIKH